MQRKIGSILLLALLTVSFPTHAATVDDSQVAYVGGTAAGVKPGALGTLDTASPGLVFTHADGKLEIPFDKIESYEYSRKLARHLGVALTVAVAMVKHLQRRHFFTITYRDAADARQVAIFEVPKQMPPVLEAVLRTRVPTKPCPPPRPGTPVCVIPRRP